MVTCAIIVRNYFSARRPSGAKIIACNNSSAWFHVQLLHAIILGSGRVYHCQSCVCVVTLKMSADEELLLLSAAALAASISLVAISCDIT